ncbi:MAG: Na/Pi symporter [Epsilonproteobacteria bacterium]|nr:Na/Pi symporter [Campylobacterota bacterium]
MESSFQSLFQAIGGVGLFLLGMTIMTDGLKQLAGGHIRAALMRFTNSPTSGAMTGAVSTMILQSSSATIVASVGFVGVGMMQFSEALGIIFGANIGTTITGWLVVLFGFKFKLAQIALPLIFFGMVLKLFFKGKLATIGYSVAGFALIFVGISLMQEGMQGFEGIITPDNLPSDSWIGRLQLVGLGILATLITQSSSAGVAATLTMLFAHTINFEQAAALVIGMDIGTTVTPLLATIGGSTDVKRTGYSHVIYNFFTGIGALLLITPYIYIWESISPDALMQNAEIGLVAFHTLFNTLGVILVLPFAHYFARFIQKIVPSDTIHLYQLDYTLPTKEPKLALISSQQALQKTFQTTLDYIDRDADGSISISKVEKSVDEIQEYLDEIVLTESKEKEWEQLIALLHGLNHLERLVDRCEDVGKERQIIQKSKVLEQIWNTFKEHNSQLLELYKSNSFTKASTVALTNTKVLIEDLDKFRDEVILKIAKDELDNYSGLELLDTIKWFKRMAKHVSRFSFYYDKALQEGVTG